jgi:Fe-S-cluster containining protein
MAVFECDRCGKCCVSLGPLIVIERQLNDRDYYCRCKIDNALFPARVDPAYRDEIADEYTNGDTTPTGSETKSCRFLRKNREGDGTICAIYPTRPKVCRDFRCYRMFIRNREGTICGRVIGKNTIRTEDAALENLWKGQVAAIPFGDFAVWIRTVTSILAEHGYCADPVE